MKQSGRKKKTSSFLWKDALLHFPCSQSYLRVQSPSGKRPERKFGYKRQDRFFGDIFFKGGLAQPIHLPQGLLRQALLVVVLFCLFVVCFFFFLPWGKSHLYRSLASRVKRSPGLIHPPLASVPASTRLQLASDWPKDIKFRGDSTSHYRRGEEGVQKQLPRYGQKIRQRREKILSFFIISLHVGPFGLF